MEAEGVTDMPAPTRPRTKEYPKLSELPPRKARRSSCIYCFQTRFVEKNAPAFLGISYKQTRQAVYV